MVNTLDYRRQPKKLNSWISMSLLFSCGSIGELLFAGDIVKCIKYYNFNNYSDEYILLLLSLLPFVSILSGSFGVVLELIRGRRLIFCFCGALSLVGALGVLGVLWSSVG
jgi:hypothetical protein